MITSDLVEDGENKK